MGFVTISAGTFTNGGTLTAPAGVDVTGGTIAGTGFLAGSLTYTSSSNSTYAGDISGTGSTVTMNKAGSTLTLSAVNTYTGGTTINAGTLKETDQSTSGSGTGAGAVTINKGGELTGSGKISGGVVLNSGGILQPGDTASTSSLTAGSLTSERWK